MDSPSLGRRPALDGLRGVAVLLVVALHLSLLARGYIGVDVFFALSGFLITALLCEESERTGRISLRTFAGRRIRRLLPALCLLLAAFVVLVLALDAFALSWPLGRLVMATLAFANNWVATFAPAHGSVLGALSPTWSLAQEAQFYVMWSCALAVLLRMRAHPRVVLALILLVAAAGVGIGSLLDARVAVYNAYTSPFDRGAELLLGGAVALVWRQRLVPAPLRHPVAGWLCVAGLLGVLADGAVSQRLSYWLAFACAAGLVVNLLAVQDARPDAPPALLARLLAARPLRHIGRRSYAVYLFHVPVYYLLWHFAPGRPRLFYLPIVLAGTLGLANLSWRFVEAPVIRSRRLARVRLPVLRPAPARVHGS